MSDTPYKVTVEEFDDEGNLVKRTVTEYIRFATGGVTSPTTDRIRVGDTLPYPNGISIYPKDGTYLVNDTRGGE